MNFTDDDVDRLARFLQFGLAGCHQPPGSADEHHTATARAGLRIVAEGRS